jgi:hypothetical protein
MRGKELARRRGPAISRLGRPQGTARSHDVRCSHASGGVARASVGTGTGVPRRRVARCAAAAHRLAKPVGHPACFSRPSPLPLTANMTSQVIEFAMRGACSLRAPGRTPCPRARASSMPIAAPIRGAACSGRGHGPARRTFAQDASADLACALSPVPETFRNLRKERLSHLRPIGEFFDHQRISRPVDLNEATQVSATQQWATRTVLRRRHHPKGVA